jgi:fluoride ion exporter CrcB/FEX
MVTDSGSAVSTTEEETTDIRLVHVGSSASSLKRNEYFQSSEVGIETRIHNDPTFDSSDVEDGGPTATSHRSRDSNIARKRVVMDTTHQEVFGGDLRRIDSTDTGDTGNTFYSQWEHQQNHTIYISVFATFGAVIRIFMGRLFGLDCERVIKEIDDFLTPFSSEICVTASGKTDQTGGAFFSDLPSNILGSFFIGVLSPAIASGHPIPWFRKDHRLQHHEAFHTALKVGLCGCLTTCKSSPVVCDTFERAFWCGRVGDWRLCSHSKVFQLTLFFTPTPTPDLSFCYFIYCL